MRRISGLWLAGCLLLLMQLSVVAQKSDNRIVLNMIEPYPLELSHEQTTNIIFPYAIQSVDRGNALVLAQKAKGVNNVLQLKAGRKDFVPTNVSVITTDGQFYSFLVQYAAAPSCLTIRIDKEAIEGTAVNSAVHFTEVSLPIDELEQTAEIMKQQHTFLHLYGKQQKMKMALQSIYLHKNLLWFTISLSNHSLIPYHNGETRFFIQDRKRSRRTAVQEREIFPLFQSVRETVAGDSCTSFVVAFSPFTIFPSQIIMMRMDEKNGGRRPHLRIKPRILLKARVLH